MADVLAGGFGLLEAPVWLAERGLLFADAVFGGVHCVEPDGTVTTVIPHRRGIGGMVPHVDGGVVISGRNLAHKWLDREGTTVLLDLADDGVVGFNDIAADAPGRVYAGSLRYYPTVRGATPRPGELYVLDVDGSLRLEVDDVLLSNGLGFSPDGTRLYHSDSERQTVFVAEVEEDGALHHREPFAVLAEGIPDGLAVSVDGVVWVAAAHAGAVLAFDPAGTMVERIELPLPMVTSLCFGGEDGRDLYVVTGSEGAASERSGAVFRVRAPVAGLAVHPAGVRLTQ